MDANTPFRRAIAPGEQKDLRKNENAIHGGLCSHKTWLAEREEDSTELNVIWSPEQYSLRETPLSGAMMPYADFSDMDMILAGCSHAKLKGSKFRGARTHSTDFAYADLTDTQMDMDSFMNIRPDFLRGATLTGMQLYRGERLMSKEDSARVINCHLILNEIDAKIELPEQPSIESVIAPIAARA